MMTPRQPLSRRRWTAFVLAFALTAGGFWALGAGTGEHKDGKKTSVTVQVDQAPLARPDDNVALSFSPIVKRVGPSVVEVTTEERAREIEGAGQGGPFDDPFFRYFFGPMMPDDQQPQQQPAPRFHQPPRQGLGSGVVVSPDGYILTNNHVVEGADTVRVRLGDGRQLTAKVVGADPKTDVAVIKVDASELPAITFADSDGVEVGDRVLAIGNPFGLGQTVTTGIVSGKGRSGAIGLDYEDFIQTDAAINPGNSGGALVDMKGRLIGINTAILSRTGGFQGVGFAIPSSLARFVMDSLVENGRVTRGYLGVGIQNVTPDIAERLGLKEPRGVAVTDVQAGSPAEKAGLQRYDVVVSLNGEEVKDLQKLRFAIASIRPGTEVKLGVLREGKERDFTVAVGELPEDGQIASTGQPGGDNDQGVLNGVGVTDLSASARRQFNIPARVEGALVTQVEPNSAAARDGLRAGDVILEINHQAVRNAEDAVHLTEEKGNGKTLLAVWSRGSTHFLVIDESEPPGN